MAKRSWHWVAQRHHWHKDDTLIQLELQRKSLASSEMVEMMLAEVFNALSHAHISQLSQEEVRRALPVFSLFFRDLVHVQQKLAAKQSPGHLAEQQAVSISGDDIAPFLAGESEVLAAVDSIRATLAAIDTHTQPHAEGISEDLGEENGDLHCAGAERSAASL